MRRLGIRTVIAGATAGALLACGASRLPAPDYVKQPTDSLQTATFPPPPARVEWVPEAPNDDAVWIDGEWSWQGARWAWKPGRWVAPPANAAFAPWTVVRDSQGTLYFAEGKWRDAKGAALPDPKPLVVGRPSASTVTDPEGETVSAPPDVPAVMPGGKPGMPGREDGSAPETPSGATPTGTEPKTEPRTEPPAPGDAG